MAEDPLVLAHVASIAWDRLHACGGTAAGVPRLVHDIVHSSCRGAVEQAWGELADTACHQGMTTYDVTPALVRVVAAIAEAPNASRVNRVSAARFLAAVAMAGEFCLPDGTLHRAVWRRRSSAPSPSRDISMECRQAVGSVAPAVLKRLLDGRPSDRPWSVALAASAFEYLQVGDVRRLLELPVAGSSRLAAAVAILRSLTSGTTMPFPWIEGQAALDPAVSDELSALIEDGSAPDVGELARCVAYRLAEVEGSDAGQEP